KTWAIGLPLLAAGTLAGALLIQLLGTIYPEDRYYSLAEFYQHRTDQPWWNGSIPLASIDFLKVAERKRAEPAEVGNPTDSILQAKRAYSLIGDSADEDSFLGNFPNPENFFLPNLFLWKLGVIKLPRAVVWAYLGLVMVIMVAGIAGLKRHFLRVEL